MIRWLLLFSVVLGLCLSVPAFAAEKTTPSFIPEIPIPGLFEETPADGTLLGKYIRAIYVYFIWIVGILGVVMIIWGGVRWIGAAGNPGRIKEAKDVVTNAIIGIILALSSVVILNTINPAFLSLQGLDLKKVVGVKLDDFEPENSCYNKIMCPPGYDQTLGGQCGLGGAYVHVNPGQDVCSTSGGKAVCCKARNPDAPKACIGVSSVDGTYTYEGACKTVTTAVTKHCSDQTLCGAVNSSSNCRGAFCLGGGVCYLKETGGECLPANGQKVSISTACGQRQVDLSSGFPCGTVSTVDADGNPRFLIGTSRGSCDNNQYCLFQPPPAALVPGSVTETQCVYNQSENQITPSPTVCSQP